MHDLSKAHASPNFGFGRIQEAGRRQQSPLARPFALNVTIDGFASIRARSHGRTVRNRSVHEETRANAENGTAVRTNRQAARYTRAIAMDPGMDRATMLHMDRGADYDSLGD